MRRAVAVLILALVAGPTVAAAPVGGQPVPPPSSAPGAPPPSPPPAGAATTLGGQPPASSAPAPVTDPAVLAAAQRGVVVAAEMAAVLDQLGALEEPVPEELAPVIDAVEWPAQDAEELIDELVVLEDAGEEVLAVLVGGVTPLDPAVAAVLGGPDDATWDRLEAGEVGFVDASPYLVALDSLARRDGRPGLDPRTPPPDGDLLAIAYDAANEAEEASDGAEGGDPTTSTSAAEAAPESDGASDEDRSPLPWILAAVVVALAAIGAVLVLARRRGADPEPPRFGDLLEVSRRLAAAGDDAQVERIAAAEAVRLVDGVAAAVVHRDGSALRAGHETDPGVLVVDRLGEGLLARVVETGQPVVAVVRDEPAVRHLPVALVAVPVISDGRVQAVVVVLRPPERPFDAQEVDTLRSLGPVLAAALDSARRVAAASTASLTDPLTGVGNRRRLEEELPPLLAGADTTAVVMVDLDHFKAVNDQWGHPAGDAVLRQAAAVLAATVRPDDRVYRYGGEEFAVVLPGADEAVATIAAERVRAALEEATMDLGDGTDHQVTASLGVAASDGGGADDALGLIGRADRALYQAKEGGRNRVVAAGTLAG